VSSTPIEEMSHTELVEKVHSLESQVDRLELLFEQLLQLGYEDTSDRLDDDINRLAVTTKIADRDDGDELADRFDEIDGLVDELRDIGSKKTSKEEKIASLVTFASNRRSRGSETDDVVALSADEVADVAGISKRYAWQLCDDKDGLPDEYEWALSKNEARETQYGSVELGAQNKRLVIDFRRLHRNSGEVNKFITNDSENGGAE